MATITQYKCPVCMLHSTTKQFTDRTLLDPSDFGWIVTKECKGKKGFPTIGKDTLINRIDEFPEVYERLKDICLGLINAFYSHDLIKPHDLVFINQILDSKDEKIFELKDRVNELVKKYNLVLDSKSEILDNLQQKHQHELDNAVENLAEEYEQTIQILKDKIYKLQSLLNDYEVESE